MFDLMYGKNCNKRSIFPQPHIMVVALARGGTLVPLLPRQTWSRYHHGTSGLRESYRRAAAAYAAAVLPLPPTPRSCQAATTAAKLAAASEVLPPCFRRRRRLRFHHHRRRHFRRRCHQCIQLMVDCCLCPRHRCHRRCLHCHRGGAWWQNSGCRGHARRRCAANALPTITAVAALPESCSCRQAAAAGKLPLPASCRCRQAATATAATALPPHFPPRCYRQ
jgi:hypothetical protein